MLLETSCYANDFYVVFPSRKVHISKATLDYLGDAYEVDPGHGETRDSYLRTHGVETFLIRKSQPSVSPSKVLFFSNIVISLLIKKIFLYFKIKLHANNLEIG